MSLIVQNLDKSFAVSSGMLLSMKSKVHALRNVSFGLEEGESLGIVGESGSGKTTLAKILAGFQTADGGDARFRDQSLLTMNRKERAWIVQMVFQDPFASLNPKLILRSQLLEAISEEPRQDKLGKAISLMISVGLAEEFLDRYPHQLSGGQRQRFAIARALARNPKILLADEPVSNLDISVQAQMINLLNDLRREFGLTLITISHDLAVIANLAQRIIVMKDGALIEAGDSQTILKDPKSDYTKKLLDSMPLV